jgi:hypothetical protein
VTVECSNGLAEGRIEEGFGLYIFFTGELSSDGGPLVAVLGLKFEEMQYFWIGPGGSFGQIVSEMVVPSASSRNYLSLHCLGVL